MLIDIRDFLRSRRVSTLHELSTHFKTSPDAMRGMLLHWQRKGKVYQENSGCNKGCSSCSPEQLEVYRWENKEGDIPLCSLD
ncbi:hypothetical protein AB835_12915 [Candidatus Endobugula sertula]|uniref:Transcriptional regulator HTH-type FeoC domain-containing protein n=1 Tax=Candidatus Endobugula sertula TaxID=62101 RepID=A0A1D2QM69_9GAMM|nr:hypothetical protein AB835_12915 [Candidatus Endobugula sertula]